MPAGMSCGPAIVRDAAAAAVDEVLGGRPRAGRRCRRRRSRRRLAPRADRAAAEDDGQRWAELRDELVAGVVRHDEGAVDVAAEQVAPGLVARVVAGAISRLSM